MTTRKWAWQAIWLVLYFSVLSDSTRCNLPQVYDSCVHDQIARQGMLCARQHNNITRHIQVSSNRTVHDTLPPWLCSLLNLFTSRLQSDQVSVYHVLRKQKLVWNEGSVVVHEVLPDLSSDHCQRVKLTLRRFRIFELRFRWPWFTGLSTNLQLVK